MDLQAVKQFLEEQKDNEEVKGYLQGLSQVTLDGATSFLETEEGKKLLQPKLDSHFTKGLETWKSNNLEKLVSDEVSKRNPSETPEQKRIRELEEKIEKSEAEAIKEKMKNHASTKLNEKKLPIFLVESLLGNDTESTDQNLTKFEEVWNAQIQTVKDAILKENGTHLEDGTPSLDKQVFSPTQLMSQAFSSSK
jgi:hypothetical protein